MYKSAHVWWSANKDVVGKHSDDDSSISVHVDVGLGGGKLEANRGEFTFVLAEKARASNMVRMGPVATYWRLEP
jgi:hypothetical protein